MISLEPVSVKVLVQPGTVPLDLIGPCQVLESANRLIAECPRFSSLGSFEIEYIGPFQAIDWLGNLTLSSISSLPEHLKEVDLLLVPGTYGDIRVNSEVIDWLARHALQARKCMAVCSGALLLAKAGLLNGRAATTHHALLEHLRTAATDIDVKKECIFVEDGNIITSAGISTGIDTLLNWLIHVAGNELVIEVARDLVIPMRRGGESPQLTSWLEGRQHGDRAVHQVQNLITMNPERRWTLSLLSEQVALGERQLRRRFQLNTGLSINEYYQRIRLDRARMLLHETTMPITLIAEAIGFCDERHFRRLWTRETGMSPASWRQFHACQTRTPPLFPDAN